MCRVIKDDWCEGCRPAPPAQTLTSAILRDEDKAQVAAEETVPCLQITQAAESEGNQFRSVLLPLHEQTGLLLGERIYLPRALYYDVF